MVHPGVTVVGPADVGADQLAEQSLLGIAHPIAPDPLTGNGGVVLERARHHPSVDGVLELFWQVPGLDRIVEDRLGRLPVVERSDQVEAGPFLEDQHLGARPEVRGGCGTARSP